MTTLDDVMSRFRRERSHVVSIEPVWQGMRRLVVVSPLSGTKTEIDIRTDGLVEWIEGRLIQDAFPELSDPQRELLMTGYTEDDWANMFPPEEDL